VAVGSNFSTPELLDLATGQQLAALPARGPGERTAPTLSLAFTPDGGAVVGTGWVWSLDDTTCLRTFGGPLVGTALAVSPDGKRLLTGDAGSLQVHDLATGAAVVPATGHRAAVDFLRFSADGSLVQTGCGGSRGRELLTWDAT